MNKNILIENIYIGYPESLYSEKDIQNDKYLNQMKTDINKLPPIKVIEISDNLFSLSDGYHRYSIFKYLKHKKIKCEIL